MPEKIVEAADDGGEAQSAEVTMGVKEAEEEEGGDLAAVDVDTAVKGQG